MSGFEVAHLDELDAVRLAEGLIWHPVRQRFDIRAFGVNAYTSAAVGEHVVERHTEKSGHEELYFVAAGRARFTVGGETFAARAGTFVFIRDSALEREAVSEEDGTTVVAVGAKPGEAFATSPWETWFFSIPAYRSGDYARAIEIHEQGLLEHPEHPTILANLAALYALTGDRERGVDYAVRALRESPGLCERIETDADYETLRDDPRLADELARAASNP